MLAGINIHPLSLDDLNNIEATVKALAYLNTGIEARNVRQRMFTKVPILFPLIKGV